MAYLGILLLLAGMASTVLTIRKPRKIVFWPTLAAILLQVFSYLVFTSILQGGMQFLWLAAGTVIGAIFARKIKLERQERTISYFTNLLFAMSYLSLLLLNQLMAVLFHVYFPFMLSIAALAAGLQAGFLGLLLRRSKKLSKAPAALLLVCCIGLLAPSNLIQVVAAGPFDISPDQVGISGVAPGDRQSYSNETNTRLGDKLEVTSGSWQEGNYGTRSYFGQMYYETIYKGLQSPDFVGTYNGYTCAVKLSYLAEMQHPANTPEDIETHVREYDVPSADSGIPVTEIPIRDYTAYRFGANNYIQDSNGQPIPSALINYDTTYVMAVGIYQLTMTYEYWPAPEEYPPVAGNTTLIPEPMDAADLDAVFIDWAQRLIDSGELEVGADSAGAGTAGSSTEDATLDDAGSSAGGNPFLPKGISQNQANWATFLSGLMAGLSALLGVLSGLAPAGPVTSMPEVPVAPEQTPASAPQTAPPAAPPQTAPASAGPPYGTRREDGKIWTRNHGWVNENSPDLNINSIKNVISSLESDLARHSANGDKLRTEIARDELARNRRELRSWEQDQKATRAAQINDREGLNQDSKARWSGYDSDLGVAVTNLKRVSLASDILLAIGTSGASTLLTAASKTMTVLTTAKEAAGMASSAVDGYMNEKKSVAQIAAEIGAGKLIGKAISTDFDKFKDAYKIGETAGKGIKVTVSVVESAVSAGVDTANDKMKVTENFGKGISSMVGGDRK